MPIGVSAMGGGIALPGLGREPLDTDGPQLAQVKKLSVFPAEAEGAGGDHDGVFQLHPASVTLLSIIPVHLLGAEYGTVLAHMLSVSVAGLAGTDQTSPHAAAHPLLQGDLAGAPYRAQTSATARSMDLGPQASTAGITGARPQAPQAVQPSHTRLSRNSSTSSVTKPLRPVEPSSLMTFRERQHSAKSSVSIMMFRVLEPQDRVDLTPRLAAYLAQPSMGALRCRLPPPAGSRRRRRSRGPAGPAHPVCPRPSGGQANRCPSPRTSKTTRRRFSLPVADGDGGGGADGSDHT